MSTNIHIKAVRNIIIPAINKQEVQEVYFEGVYQTPTKVSHAIRDSFDPIAAYKEWVLATFTNSYKEPIYPEWCVMWDEGDIIGYREVNPAVEHCVRLDDWCNGMKEEGYRIEVECW